MAFHLTFVIIQHYPFLKKYKYFKTNIENKSFRCNKLHSLPRIFSLLKRKVLHPPKKKNQNINVEQSLEEESWNVNLCSKLDLKGKKKEKQFYSHVVYINSVLKLLWHLHRELPELHTIMFLPQLVSPFLNMWTIAFLLRLHHQCYDTAVIEGNSYANILTGKTTTLKHRSSNGV